MEVFMQRFGNPHEYQPGRPIPPIAYEVTQKISDDLKPFKKKVSLPVSSDGKAFLPNDYVHVDTIIYSYSKNGQSKTKRVKILSNNKYYYRLESDLVSPSKAYPICSLQSDHIEFAPSNLRNVEFSYLRQPGSPKWDYTLVNNREVYNPSGSVDFEFEDIVHNEICMKILSYIGVHLREPDLIQLLEHNDLDYDQYQQQMLQNLSLLNLKQ